MGSNYLNLTGVANSSARTPNAAAFDITTTPVGLFWVGSLNWPAPSAFSVFMAHWLTSGNARGYSFAIGTNGRLNWNWSVVGSDSNNVASGVATGFAANETVGVGVVFTPDNGSGQRVTAFYKSVDMGANWSLLETATTTAGATSMFAASGASLEIGGQANGALNNLNGRCRKAWLFGGTFGSGSALASPEFSITPAGASSLTDAQGNVWSVIAPASVLSDQNTAGSLCVAIDLF